MTTIILCCEFMTVSRLPVTASCGHQHNKNPFRFISRPVALRVYCGRQAVSEQCLKIVVATEARECII